MILTWLWLQQTPAEPVVPEAREPGRVRVESLIVSNPEFPKALDGRSTLEKRRDVELCKHAARLAALEVAQRKSKASKTSDFAEDIGLLYKHEMLRYHARMQQLWDHGWDDGEDVEPLALEKCPGPEHRHRVYAYFLEKLMPSSKSPGDLLKDVEAAIDRD